MAQKLYSRSKFEMVLLFIWRLILQDIHAARAKSEILHLFKFIFILTHQVCHLDNSSCSGSEFVIGGVGGFFSISSLFRSAAAHAVTCLFGCKIHVKVLLNIEKAEALNASGGSSPVEGNMARLFIQMWQQPCILCWDSVTVIFSPISTVTSC